MKYLFQLIRPLNLVIIAFTMYSTRLFLYLYEVKFNATIFQKSGEEIDFFLMVFSTLLIAAAGNMINDYFDVKADRVNKPEKLIITKYVKRRVAILNHWILNLIAFSIAIYLSARNNTLWYVFIKKENNLKKGAAIELMIEQKDKALKRFASEARIDLSKIKPHTLFTYIGMWTKQLTQAGFLIKKGQTYSEKEVIRAALKQEKRQKNFKLLVARSAKVKASKRK